MTLAVLALCLAAPPSASPYDVPWLLDGAALAAMATYMYVEPFDVPNRPDCPRAGGACDPSSLPSFDRRIVGNDSQTWATASNWTRDSTKVLAAGAVLADALTADTQQPVQDALRDGLVIALSATSAELVTHVAKRAIARPRPLQYTRDTYEERSVNDRSMPSGHVTTAAAWSSAYATTFALRHPDSPWFYAIAALGAGLTAVTAYGRMAAGQHFPSDVVAAAAIGTAAGIGIPLLHRRDVAVVASGETVALMIRF